MGHNNLQTTALGRATALQQQAERVLPFLISYKDMVTLNDLDVEAISKLRTFSNTVINELSMLAGNEGKFHSLLFLNFNNFNQTVPEVLTFNDVTIDGKTLDKAPEPLQKAWINLTPIIGKKRNPSDPINITDIPRMQQLVLRGLLVMSYNDAEKIWLEPRLCVFIVESYSMLIASKLQMAFNLNFDEMRFVQTIFALYCAQLLCVGEDSTTSWPSLINRCSFLGSQSEINDKLNLMEDVLGNDRTLSIDKCISVIKGHGAPRMSNFEGRMLYQMFGSTNAEATILPYALDYPPYWIYLILKALSNDKNPFLNTLFRVTDLKKKAMLFASDLRLTKTFIQQVNRNAK